MAEEVERLSLATLLDGVAVARFDDELAKVLRNIVDPNTPAEAKREVTLKVSIKPDRDRDLGKVAVSVSSKLAPPEMVGTRIFIAQTRSGPVATEHNPNQPSLPMDMGAKVTEIRPGGGK